MNSTLTFQPEAERLADQTINQKWRELNKTACEEAIRARHPEVTIDDVRAAIEKLFAQDGHV